MRLSASSIARNIILTRTVQKLRKIQKLVLILTISLSVREDKKKAMLEPSMTPKITPFQHTPFF